MGNNKFYAVQFEVDGFGHDTATWRCFKTKESAKEAIKKVVKKGMFSKGRLQIVEQQFGTDYIEIYD